MTETSRAEAHPTQPVEDAKFIEDMAPKEVPFDFDTATPLQRIQFFSNNLAFIKRELDKEGIDEGHKKDLIETAKGMEFSMVATKVDILWLDRYHADPSAINYPSESEGQDPSNE